jgi:hypothetical protein
MKNLFISLFLAITICLMQFTACLQAQSASSTDPQALIQQLRSENEALKQELQHLRKLLATSLGQPSGTAVTQTSSTAIASPQTVQQQSTEFWLTSSSKKRHNSSCRYYQNSNGRSCNVDEGIPCKICGG